MNGYLKTYDLAHRQSAQIGFRTGGGRYLHIVVDKTIKLEVSRRKEEKNYGSHINTCVDPFCMTSFKSFSVFTNFIKR